uniref:RNA-binding protein Hfq n=1 Tax=mine drainage metagenome TaxID=410659 RepID=E6QHP6_9ZZZZ
MKAALPVNQFEDRAVVASASAPASLDDENREAARPRRKRGLTAQIRAALPFAGHPYDVEHGQHDAELFYFQKQIQMQTPMVIVLEDGKQIQGVIEWYDRNSIKVRGRQRQLIYKSAIKYIYKHGENGATGGQ